MQNQDSELANYSEWRPRPMLGGPTGTKPFSYRRCQAQNGESLFSALPDTALGCTKPADVVSLEARLSDLEVCC